jgi:TetR/AcrR family transcriptional repressor of nem operon
MKRKPRTSSIAGRTTSVSLRGSRVGETRLKRSQQRAEGKRQTREALLAAGLEAVIEEGLDAGLDGICARAGYTRGAFYVHFKNREELLVAITEHVLGAIVEAALVVDPARGVAASIDRFSEGLEAGAWPLVPKIRIATVRMMDAMNRWPAIRSAFDGFLGVAIERLTHLIARDQAAGRARNDVGARELANALVTMAMGTIMLTNTGIRIDRGAQRALLQTLIRPPRAAAAHA